MFKQEVKKFPPNVQLPAEYSLTAMATEIYKCKGREPYEPELSAIRQTAASRAEWERGNNNSSWTKCWLGWNTPTSRVTMEWAHARLPTKTILHQWNVPSIIKTGYHKPNKCPVPDAAKTGRKKESQYDPTIVCDACGQPGHPAN